MAAYWGSEVEESGESRSMISFSRLRKWACRKRVTSAVTFDADFRFTGLMIVRERNGSESVVTPLSNAQRVRNLLRCTEKTMVDSFKNWRSTTSQKGGPHTLTDTTRRCGWGQRGEERHIDTVLRRCAPPPRNVKHRMIIGEVGVKSQLIKYFYLSAD